MKKIIVFGNKKITIKCLDILKKNKEIQLVAIVGCETENDLKMGNPSIKEYCLRNNLRYHQPDKLNKDFLELLKELRPDICFSFFYRDIFSLDFLSIAKDGFINIHPSLLPEYRGPVPYLWALLNGEKLTGVTLHYIDQGIDSGDMIGQKEYKIPKLITGFELGNKLMDLGVELFKEQLSSIIKGTNKRLKQDNRKATYYGQYHPSLRKINWYNLSTIILGQIQAFAKPFSGTTAVLGEEEIVIWKAKIVNLSKRKLHGPGKIVKIFKNNSFIVSTVDGYLQIDEFEINQEVKLGERFLLTN